jgi:demethylmenaquinone methyltransferase / 2-methoxy-6-polyprenyl-1,4-benzoquinol methylase
LNHPQNSGHPLQSYYSRIYRTYDLVNHVFTFGQDKKWRRHLVDVLLKYKPGRILDLCCGTGDLSFEVAGRTKSPLLITGYDLNNDMLNIAREKLGLLKYTHVEFLQGDAAEMPFPDAEFDAVIIGFGFRNLTFENPNCQRNIGEISRVMKPGSCLLILESAPPENHIIGWLHRIYLKAVLVPLGGLLSGYWDAYRYLAGSSVKYYKFPELQALLQQGFANLEIAKSFLFGAANIMLAIRKGG